MFEDRSIRRRRRYLLVALFILMVSAAFMVGYFLNASPEASEDDTEPPKVSFQIPDSLLYQKESNEPAEQVNANNTDEQGVISPNEELTPNTQLIFKTYFSSCRHTIEKSIQASGDETSMSEQQLKEKYAGWEISAFSPPVVEFSRTIDTYCPNHYIIGVSDGFIAIYVYDENGQKTMAEKTDISTATLTPEDQQALRGGIVVYTEDQKEQTLEGFSE